MRRFTRMATNWQSTAKSFGWVVKDNDRKCYGCGEGTNVGSYIGTYWTNSSQAEDHEHICNECINEINKTVTGIDYSGIHIDIYSKFVKNPKLFETQLSYSKEFRCPKCHKHIKACNCKPTKAFRSIKQ